MIAPPSRPLAVALRPLDWDTDFFGARMGVIARAEGQHTPGELAGDLAAALSQAREEDYAHVIFRTGAEDVEAIWAAEGVGMRLVDVGVDSSIDLSGTQVPAVPEASGVRPVREGDLPGLQELAGAAFVLSRFSADPFFTPQQVRAFHRQWVANLVGGLAAAVLVREVDGEIAGFVSCGLAGPEGRSPEGRIPLIASSEAHRRQGVGRSLVAASLRWFGEAGARQAHVKTQAHNYPALALYHGAGFRVSKTDLTFSAAPKALTRP